MKRNIALIVLMMLSCGLFAQENFKYIIIPLHVSEIGSGLNPYSISSSAMKAFNEKSIKSVFEKEEIPEDYCQALTLKINDASSMFKNKLNLELHDCNNRIVWKGEGTGDSKDFKAGYYEAIVDALKDLDELPPMEWVTEQRYLPAKKEMDRTTAPRTTATVANPARSASVETGEEIYRPGNLYFNYRYFVDFIEGEDDTAFLKIINGELLGYDNLQVIATLNPSGIDGVYTVEWINPGGSKQGGVANLSGGWLKISLKSDGEKEVISLQKY